MMHGAYKVKPFINITASFKFITQPNNMPSMVERVISTQRLLLSFICNIASYRD